MEIHAQLHNRSIVNNCRSPYCVSRSADLDAVKWRPGFWQRRFDQCKDVTIPHLWKRLSDPNLGHALTNLRIYAGLEQGEFQGTAWQDEWVYKWLEAAACVYSHSGDESLVRQMDEVIDVIAKAQEPDGRLASQILRFKQRFLKPGNHELYVMGHLITAACVHHRVTGKTNFLDVARRVADYLFKTFMPRPPQLAHFGINPSYIMATVELYRTTGEKKYLDLANTFIDMRGSAPGGTDLNQTRVPLRKETHVVGHAVFYTYLFAGAADAYMETGDASLLEALERLWKDLAYTKMYVTGGVCSIHRGLSIRFDDVHEAAGAEYDLPNSTAYNETCSQIGNFMWNWRMLLLGGNARHADIMERNLYNSILSGIGLDGASWFYTNPLRWHGKDHPLLSQDAYERFQPGEPPHRAHICCPSNLVRTIAGLHGYFYSLDEDGIRINHYGASVFEGQLLDGSQLKLAQQTDYPWDGKVALSIEKAPAKKISIQFRIPKWAAGASVKVNGRRKRMRLQPGFYAGIKQRWAPGDTIELDMPMKVRLLEAHPRVEQTRNHAAVMRGPIVYCLESPDLPPGLRVSQIRLPRKAKLTARRDESLLGGVVVLEGKGLAAEEGDWSGRLYREMDAAPMKKVDVRLIPYYAWANRGVSEMTVWIPLA